MAGDDLEARTREIGQEIFARIREAEPSILSPRWWDDRLMALSMRDPAVKVQLFRLVDTLPSLKSHRAVTRHLREYLATVGDRLPHALRRGLQWIPEDGVVGQAVAALARFNA